MPEITPGTCIWSYSAKERRDTRLIGEPDRAGVIVPGFPLAGIPEKQIGLVDRQEYRVKPSFPLPEYAQQLLESLKKNQTTNLKKL